MIPNREVALLKIRNASPALDNPIRHIPGFGIAPPMPHAA
jgi:hypothetical protein